MTDTTAGEAWRPTAEELANCREAIADTRAAMKRVFGDDIPDGMAETVVEVDWLERVCDHFKALAAHPPAGAQGEDDLLHKMIVALKGHVSAIQEGKRTKGSASLITDCINDLPRIIAGLENAEFNIEAAFEEYEDRATPAQPDTGYTDAFYQLAEMMGLAASPKSPRVMWETVMQPRLQELLAQPDTGDVAALREALKWLEWARPKAVSAMEDHRSLRVRAGHDMKGTYRSGTTYVGLYQSEVDEIEESADFIVNLRNRLAALSKPNAQGREG